MGRPLISVTITVNATSHSVYIVYTQCDGLVAADRRFRVKQGPGGVHRTLERLTDSIREALLFAEAELDFPL